MRLSALAPFALCLPLCTILGCELDPDGPAPDEREDVIDELPAQPLPLPDSPTAYGMLRVANELDFAALDREVGLDRQAAESIIAHRVGPDGYLGTADDRFVSDLGELDGLYWLGEENLWRLQAYALLEGYAPDAMPQACDPALDEVLVACRRLATELAGSGNTITVDPIAACLDGGEPDGPATELFAGAGLPRYLEPALGYFAMLCGDGAETSVCALGVAGLADLAMSECVKP
ncbi:hypothetical protein [Paraliomyxa miuraensis]|uniref:hypothetical protein n=1 Tax=Paraliomyxa miuraensis TaxID=376150 RepID=UPI00224FC754|nr:hypothetical protein [Paraliomyxa miuraensis]MCX4246301.1 hypothetical protein [Paraliomyxa miuraensis]